MRAVALGLLLACAASCYAAEQSDRELTHLMVGAWRSPRHDYVYLADGTWWMGKPDPNGGHARPLMDQVAAASEGPRTEWQPFQLPEPVQSCNCQIIHSVQDDRALVRHRA